MGGEERRGGEKEWEKEEDGRRGEERRREGVGEGGRWKERSCLLTPVPRLQTEKLTSMLLHLMCEPIHTALTKGPGCSNRVTLSRVEAAVPSHEPTRASLIQAEIIRRTVFSLNKPESTTRGFPD